MKYNFEFINYQQITTKFIWNDSLHLLDTGKSILDQNFVNKVTGPILDSKGMCALFQKKAKKGQNI